MKNKTLFALMSLLFLMSCTPWDGNDIEYNYSSAYKPILMERTALETSIKLIEPQSINVFGKIYRFGTILFINEKFEGIHIIDNSDPQNPVKTGFITIPGNIDIAVKDGLIYADSGGDPIIIEYDGISVKVVDRNREVFPELQSPDGYGSPDLNNRPENTVIVKWTEI
jgi:hypothetical protein